MSITTVVIIVANVTSGASSFYSLDIYFFPCTIKYSVILVKNKDQIGFKFARIFSEQLLLVAVVLGLGAGPHVCRWSGRGSCILVGPLELVPGLRLVLVQGVDLHGQ